jgi:hypothetical protein
MTRKAVLSGSGKGGEKRLGNETSLAAYFIVMGQEGECPSLRLKHRQTQVAKTLQSQVIRIGT